MVIKRVLLGAAKQRKITLAIATIYCWILVNFFKFHTYYTFETYTLNTDLDISRDINKEGDDSRLYLRYDEAGVQPIPGTARSHHLPFAIPASRTIPRHLADDMAYHLSQRRNTTSRSVQGKSYRLSHDYSKDHRTLYLYNPHVLPLHNTIEISGSSKSDPDFLSKSDLHALTGGDSSVRYLVTYRAFLGCNCFGILPKRQIMRAGEMISYLAIALLDEHLDVINGTDVLVDFNLSPQKGGRNDYVVSKMLLASFFGFSVTPDRKTTHNIIINLNLP